VSPWVPRALIALLALAIGYAIYSIAVGEGGPRPADVGGVNDVQRIFGGIPQDADALGADDAEVTVSVFNDIQCEPCAQWQIDVIDPLVEGYARTGEARFEFRHFSVAPNDTTLAAIAAESAGRQEREWQYVDTFVRNQDLARRRGVDEELLREIAGAVPELDVDRWARDYDAPETVDLVREDAMLAAELKLPAEPAVVVSGPGGQRELIETPSPEEIRQAIEEVA
jgi:protein-disulfide isomerase